MIRHGRATLLMLSVALAAPVRLHDEPPVQIIPLAPNLMLVDLGREAFGNLRLGPSQETRGPRTIHFGEALRDGRVDRQPPGSVRYAYVSVPAATHRPLVVAEIPPGVHHFEVR